VPGSSCRAIQAEDDSKAEKLARDATEGKLRGRQRDGALGEFDLSDDEDESQRKRKREHRKYERKLENDELRHMGKLRAYVAITTLLTDLNEYGPSA
jgi:hypothetical protein